MDQHIPQILDWKCPSSPNAYMPFNMGNKRDQLSQALLQLS